MRGPRWRPGGRDLISHLSNLDYPRSKPQILLLLEEEDTETLVAAKAAKAAKAAQPPEELKNVVVPSGDPQTKPRACNYGLSFVRASCWSSTTRRTSRTRSSCR